MLFASANRAFASALLRRNLAPKSSCIAVRSMAAHPAVHDYMPRPKGLLLDAAGTLISPSEPAAEVRQAAYCDASGQSPLVLFGRERVCAPLQVYLRFAGRYGCKLSEAEVLRNFRRCSSSASEASLMHADVHHELQLKVLIKQ